MSEYDVIKKLIGPIEPIGETNEDNRRLVNLQKMSEVVGAMLDDIVNVIKNKHRMEYSMKIAGEFAHSWCYATRIQLENELLNDE
jgi:hypothetical protein